MESQPQNPEFRNNPDNCHPCKQVFATYGICTKLIAQSVQLIPTYPEGLHV